MLVQKRFTQIKNLSKQISQKQYVPEKIQDKKFPRKNEIEKDLLSKRFTQDLHVKFSQKNIPKKYKIYLTKEISQNKKLPKHPPHTQKNIKKYFVIVGNTA